MRLRRVLPQRLGRQLQWMVALSLALTLVVFGAYTIRQQTALALANLEDQAAALARGAALAAVDPLLTDKLDAVEDMALHAARLPQVLDLAVLSPQGASLAHVQRVRGGDVKATYDPPQWRAAVPGRLQAQVTVDEATTTVVAWHPIAAGSHLGWVRVALDSKVLGAIRERIWLSTLAIGLAAGVASIVLLSRLMAKPMQAINEARDFAVGLERIEGQKLVQPHGPEETMALGRALNQASMRLHQQRQSIDDSFAALMRQEAAVTEANEQLRTIFALSPDALVSFDVQGHVKFANEAFYKMTGLRAAQVLEQPATVVDGLLRALCAEPGEYPGLEVLFDSGSAAPDTTPDSAADTGALADPLRLNLAQPRASVLEVVGLRGESQAVSRLLYLRDITHETEVERMKSAFLHTAAHELRTPMTAIHSCVDLMLLREFTPDKRRQLLDIVHRHSRTLMHIVDELLELARLEARSASDFEFEDAVLAQQVVQAVADFVPPEGRAAPELLVTEPTALVHVDKRRLKQVVANLLSNAYKYSSEGTVWVRVQASPGGNGQVGFEVQDQGIGMTPEQLARVGERFYRADVSGHVLGTGLGLSIVMEMVGLMKGGFSKASRLGEGTTFGVWFSPVREADIAAPPEPESPHGTVREDQQKGLHETVREEQQKSPHETVRAVSAV